MKIVNYNYKSPTCNYACVHISLIESSDDLQTIGKSLQINAPHLLVYQTAEEITIHIMVERETLRELNSFKSALIHLVPAYFVFDISYPKSWYSTLIFIQHQVFNLADKPRVLPKCYRNRLKNIKNVKV